jgi:hypothetical protein
MTHFYRCKSFIDQDSVSKFEHKKGHTHSLSDELNITIVELFQSLRASAEAMNASRMTEWG